jgi:hypothetical protein
VPTYAFTIAASSKTIRSGSLRISETANGRNTMSCDVVSTNGSYRPAIGAEVILTEDGTRIFGGLIDSTYEAGVGEYGSTAIVNSITCVDFNSYAERMFITNTSTSTTLEAWIDYIVAAMVTAGFSGVTKHGSQATGPTLPDLSYNNRLLRDVLDEFSALSGYTWNFDYSKVFRMISPGSSAAPFNVVPSSDSNAIGDITYESSRPDFANRVILEYGQGIQSRTEEFVGNSSNRVFALDLPMAGFPNPVTVNGDYVHVAEWVGDGSDLFEWTYRASDNSIVQLAEAPTGTAHAALTSGDDLVVIYPAQYPAVVYSPTSPPADLREKRMSAPDVFDPEVAQELADVYVARYGITYKKATYDTFQTGIVPGMHQTITVSGRNISGTHLVTDVETRDVPTVNSAYRLRRTVTAVSGTTYPGSWRDDYRQMTGGGGSSSVVTLSGVPLITNGGMFATNVFAGHLGDGTNNLYEESLQMGSKSTLGGPGLQLGQATDTYRWNIFADFVRDGGGTLQSGLVINPASETQGAIQLRVYDTNKVVLAAVNSATYFALGSKTSYGLGSGWGGHYIDIINADTLDVTNGHTAYGRTVKEGEWADIPHANSTFLGDGVDADWDVASGDMNTYKTSTVGKTMTANFTIVTSTVAAGVRSLQIIVPGTISGNHYAVGFVTQNGSTTTEPVLISAENGNAYIGINLIGVPTDFTASTNNFGAFGQVTFEIA